MQLSRCDAVVAGGSSARVLDLTGAEIKDIQAEAVELPIGQSVFSVAWSPDGQLLTVSTTVRTLVHCVPKQHEVSTHTVDSLSYIFASCYPSGSCYPDGLLLTVFTQ